MKLRICSDLHLECVTYSTIPTLIEKNMLPSHDDDKESILCLAGDICSIFQFEQVMENLCFRFKHVVYVPGNHEFYHMNLDNCINQMIQKTQHLANFHYNGGIIDDVNFICETLWSDNKRTGNETIIAKALNDFNCIFKMTIKKYNQLHKDQLFSIEKQLENSNMKTVVITHHLPSLKSVSKKYIKSDINDAFVTPLDYLIEKYQPELWIHGHTHDSCDYNIGNTNIICNPFGYKNFEENTSFIKELFVDI